MRGIVTIDPQNPGGFAPLLAGAAPAPFRGTPAYLGYQLDGAAFAALIADCLDDGVFLRWLAVDEPCRGRGYGRLLVETLCRFAAKAGAKWVQACVSSTQERPATAMGALLTNCGFQQTEDSPAFHFPLDALEHSPYAGYLAMSDAHIEPISMLSEYQCRHFDQRMQELGEAQGALLCAEGLLREDSMIWLEQGKIRGCILLAACGADLELRWVYCTNPKLMPALLGTAYQTIRRQYPPQTLLHVAAINPAVEPLLEKFVGEALQEEMEILHFEREM